MALTPEALLALPRRSVGIPSPSGRLILHTVSTYSFESHSAVIETKVLDLVTKVTHVVTTGGQDATWIGDGDLVLWLKGGSDGETEFWIADAGDLTMPPYRAGRVDGPIFAPKFSIVNDHTIAIAFAGKASTSGTLFNPRKAPKPHSSAMEYDTSPARFWDTWLGPERNTIWYSTLTKSSITEVRGEWYRLDHEIPINALKGSGSVSPTLKEVDNSGDFAISAKGIAFVAKDPEVGIIEFLKSDVYYLAIDDFRNVPSGKPEAVMTPNYDGIASCPVFSSDGKSLALLRLPTHRYWYGLNGVFVVPDVATQLSAVNILDPGQLTDSWDISPDAVRWSNCCQKLYLTAEEKGHVKLYMVPARKTTSISMPEILWGEGSVMDAIPLTNIQSNTQILLTTSSFTQSSTYNILDTSNLETTLISTLPNTSTNISKALSSSQVSSFWIAIPGRPYRVHVWEVRPPNFDENKTYPVAFLLHGGPYQSFNEAWSVRWNPVLIANQGFVVYLPNFTGSSGYGSEFSERIRKEWGGRPYDDIVASFEHVRDNISYADTSRAVAAGGSYGGLLINWIAGHPLGKEFKCLVSHDGIFSIVSKYGADIVDVQNDFGGEIWEPSAQEVWAKWDPSRFVQNWTTPMLFINGELDYRCAIPNSLAPYMMCQRRGIESRLLVFPDEGHQVLKAENQRIWWRTVLGWINKFVGNEGEGKVILERALSEAMLDR